jgi:predicted nucleic acid-binding protein
MSQAVFVDTSVLIRSEDGADEAGRALVMAWLQRLWMERLGRISTQVLNDFYRLVTTRIKPPMPNGDARAEVRRYQRWQPWALDHATVESAWSIESRFALPYADALIVAAAKAQGCVLLLSLDLPHELVFDSVQVINPLLVGPERIEL